MIRNKISIPPAAQFPRLDDYAGAWAIEPTRFHAIWNLAKSLDLPAHVSRVSQVAPSPSRSTTSNGNTVVTSKGKNIAVLSINGLLMKSASSIGGTSTVQLRRDVRSAAANPNVQGILLAVDSPGGTAAGAQALSDDVFAASKEKPVFAWIDDLGASAAYYAIAGANLIYAARSTSQIGSIGTIIVVYDTSGAAEKEGVKALVFATGPLKATGMNGVPVTPEQQQYLQSRVDQLQTSFDGAVMRGRNMGPNRLSPVKSGGVFFADEAKRLKLIDGLKSFEEVLDFF
jgi:protease-4